MQPQGVVVRHMLLGGARHGVVVLVHRYRPLGEVHQGVTVAGGHPGMDLGWMTMMMMMTTMMTMMTMMTMITIMTMMTIMTMIIRKTIEEEENDDASSPPTPAWPLAARSLPWRSCP